MHVSRIYSIYIIFQNEPLANRFPIQEYVTNFATICLVNGEGAPSQFLFDLAMILTSDCFVNHDNALQKVFVLQQYFQDNLCDLAGTRAYIASKVNCRCCCCLWFIPIAVHINLYYIYIQHSENKTYSTFLSVRISSCNKKKGRKKTVVQKVLQRQKSRDFHCTEVGLEILIMHQ